jgi:hypothetical protein
MVSYCWFGRCSACTLFISWACRLAIEQLQIRELCRDFTSLLDSFRKRMLFQHFFLDTYVARHLSRVVDSRTIGASVVETLRRGVASCRQSRKQQEKLLLLFERTMKAFSIDRRPCVYNSIDLLSCANLPLFIGAQFYSIADHLRFGHYIPTTVDMVPTMPDRDRAADF